MRNHINPSGNFNSLGSAAKLVKLIPRLGSDHDGEVIATARAIGRTLKRANSSWHDLASALTTPLDHRLNGDISDVLRHLRNHPGLSAWEASFIESICSQQARRRRLTEKQRAVIQKILDRVE